MSKKLWKFGANELVAQPYLIGSKIVYGTHILQDKTINRVYLFSSNSIELSLPEVKTDGTGRDLLLLIETESTATGTLKLPAVSGFGDNSITITVGKNYLISYIQIGYGSDDYPYFWLVKCTEIEKFSN